jgi:hypothetical protein
MNLGNLGRHTLAAPLAAFTLVAGGGIALAASGGGDPAPQATEHRQAAPPSAKPTDKPTDKPTKEPKPDRTEQPNLDASPSPSLTGLCKAYNAGGYASSTKNGHVNPAWSALESAAGGADDVDGYCDDVLAADAAAKAARKDADDDGDEPKAGKPDKGPKSDKAQRGDNDDQGDADDSGDIDNDDADDQGDGGSRSSEHGRH